MPRRYNLKNKTRKLYYRADSAKEEKRVYEVCQKYGCDKEVNQKNGKYCSKAHAPHAGRYEDGGLPEPRSFYPFFETKD